jgi:hypothetical protein
MDNLLAMWSSAKKAAEGATVIRALRDQSTTSQTPL